MNIEQGSTFYRLHTDVGEQVLGLETIFRIDKKFTDFWKCQKLIALSVPCLR